MNCGTADSPPRSRIQCLQCSVYADMDSQLLPRNFLCRIPLRVCVLSTLKFLAGSLTHAEKSKHEVNLAMSVCYQIYRVEKERLRFVEEAVNLETAQRRTGTWELTVPGDYLLFEFASNGLQPHKTLKVDLHYDAETTQQQV